MLSVNSLEICRPNCCYFGMIVTISLSGIFSPGLCSATQPAKPSQGDFPKGLLPSHSSAQKASMAPHCIQKKSTISQISQTLLSALLSPSNPVSHVGSLLQPWGVFLLHPPTHQVLLRPLSLLMLLQFPAFLLHHPSPLSIIIQLTPLSRTTLTLFKKSSLIISILFTSLSPTLTRP